MVIPDLDSEAINRIVEMAWEDRTPFEAITLQFGLDENQVIALMRQQMLESSFKMWRKRVSGRKTKHLKQRDFAQGRFRSQNQKGSWFGLGTMIRLMLVVTFLVCLLVAVLVITPYSKITAVII